MHHAGAVRLSRGKAEWLLLAIVIGFVPGHPARAERGPCAFLEDAPGVESESSAAPAERFQCARHLSRERDYRGAIRAYEVLSEDYPDNVDYLFGEAQARFWSGDTRGALRLLARARRLAPAYEDVWRLEYQALGSLAGEEATRRREAFRAAALRRFPEAPWLRREALEAPAPELHWETGMNIDHLDNGASNWQQVYAHIDRRSQDGGMLYVTASEHRRFSLTDGDVSFGGALKPAPDWLVEGGLELVPDADFLPEVVADLGLSRILDDGWIAGLDVRQRRYPDQTVSTFGLGIERYFGSYRAAWQIQNTHIASASSFVYSGTLNYYADGGSRYGLTVAAGDEVEVVAPGQLLQMDISSVALTGRHPVGERLSILWRVGTHR
ncbi:MAG TPA: YaiO family outer membrane beta-barrel protein, partial [Woeseiaceae bacterium]|nr:YaiO family outer membrane beta-barrel protein [Woeseiaceae bacterium]